MKKTTKITKTTKTTKITTPAKTTKITRPTMVSDNGKSQQYIIPYISQFIVKRVGGKKQKVGVLVGMMDMDGAIKIGWSRAKINGGDKFNPKLAITIAQGRLLSQTFVPIAPSLFDDAIVFACRCKRYFKEAKSLVEIVKQCQIS